MGRLGSRLYLFVKDALSGNRGLRIYQVFVNQERNHLGSRHFLYELYFRARDSDDAMRMLELFKQKYPYPKYSEPHAMGWVGKQLFMFRPNEHNVVWRAVGPDETCYFCSGDIAHLNAENEMKP